MDIIYAPTYGRRMNQNPREKFGNYAGAGYVVSGGVLTFKGVVEDLMASNEIKADELQDSLSGIGALMLASSLVIAFFGNNSRGMGTGYALSAAGWGLMISQMLTADADVNISTAVGAATGFGACAHAVYKSVRAEFVQVVQDVSEKQYPYLLTGAMSLLSASTVMIGAFQQNDMVTTAVGGGWSACAVLIGLSKPRSPAAVSAVL